MTSSASSRSSWTQDLPYLVFFLFLAFAIRFFILIQRGFEIFNADHAVIGLMAKHIMEGHPMVYFYGQGYMGSLEAFVAALFFSFFGMDIWVLQCAPLFFYLAFLVVNYFFVK